MKKEEIEDIIFSNINICNCQRNADRIFPVLEDLLLKLQNKDLTVENYTNEELLIIALLDRRVNFITHGINIEYPIAFNNDIDYILSLIKQWKEIK